MATIQKGNVTFSLLDEIQANHPRLVQLILETESMDDSQRQYWFDMLPSMNTDQVNRLLEILETERAKLDELEKKYQSEVEQLNQKHVTQWEAYSIQKKKEEIAQQEAQDKNNQGDANTVLSDW